MSYNLSVSGHSVTETPEDAKQAEEQALAAARSFVSGLPDATSAMFDGQHTGHTDLLEKVEPQPEQAA
jgi:hypothetical protein